MEKWLDLEIQARERENKGLRRTFGGNTLAEAVADAFKTASYHMAYHDDVRVSQIIDTCKFCEGNGRVPTGKLYKYKRCPKCNGENPYIVACDGFVPKTSLNVKIVPKE